MRVYTQAKFIQRLFHERGPYWFLQQRYLDSVNIGTIIKEYLYVWSFRRVRLLETVFPVINYSLKHQ